ncbi:sugar-binding domain-containing protein [Streptomyces sp. NPDC056244]|uniref:sugar-binding domain-containing protein n=1 Tax=Streptomyces sp. NPDC056244 TaxID=3345762 RepID=UPI0035D7535E
MLAQQRDAAAESATAYFPGGTYKYRRTFRMPEHLRGQRVVLEFEGVYRDATVTINGALAGQRPYGYSRFRIDADQFLRPGEDNEIRVVARSHQDSRWYPGAGIYRDVWLLTGDPLRITPDGIRITTPDIDDERATVDIATTVANDSLAIRTVDVDVSVQDPAGSTVATWTSPLTRPARRVRRPASAPVCARPAPMERRRPALVHRAEGLNGLVHGTASSSPQPGPRRPPGCLNSSSGATAAPTVPSTRRGPAWGADSSPTSSPCRSGGRSTKPGSRSS